MLLPVLFVSSTLSEITALLAAGGLPTASPLLGLPVFLSELHLTAGSLLYGSVFALAAVMCVLGAWHARYLPHRDARHGLLALLLTSALWAGAQLVFLASEVYVVSYTAYTGGLVVGFATVWAWLYFCSAYSGRTLHRHPLAITLSLLVFTAVTVLKLTNGQHGLYFSVTAAPAPLVPFTISRHALYWMTTGLSYLLVLGGFLMLAAHWARVRTRAHVLVALFGVTLFPLVGNAIGLAVPAMAGLYHEPLGVALFALGVLFLARDAFVTVHAVGRHSEPALVLRPDGEVHTYNTSAEALLPNLTPEALGRPLREIAPAVARARTALRPVVEVRHGGSLRYYRLTESCLHTGTAPVHLVTLSDITERERRLRAHEQLLHTITESVSDGLFQISRDRGLVYANQALADMLGYASVDALQGAAPNDLFADPDAERLHTALRRDGAFTGEVTCLRHTGPCFTGRVSATLVEAAPGGPSYYNGSLVDLTVQKEREQALRKAKEEAEATARLKEYMLSTMSHEVRTPLTAILGFADMLRSDMQGAHADFARRIYQSGKRLERMLESVLTLSKLESGTYVLNTESVEMLTFLEEIRASFRSQAQRNQLDLNVAVSGPASTACIDAGGTRLILRHLIDNALKFTPPGGTVTVHACCGDDRVQFVVEDDGIGIPDNVHDTIFESFRQVSEGRNRSHEGAGLGLAVVRAFVTLMGGSVEVESTVGQGSRFTVSLPLAEAHQPAATS